MSETSAPDYPSRWPRSSSRPACPRRLGHASRSLWSISKGPSFGTGRDLKIAPSGQTIVKPTALGPVANTDTKLLIYGLFQKGRVLAQDGVRKSSTVALCRESSSSISARTAASSPWKTSPTTALCGKSRSPRAIGTIGSTAHPLEAERFIRALRNHDYYPTLDLAGVRNELPTASPSGAQRERKKSTTPLMEATHETPQHTVSAKPFRRFLSLPISRDVHGGTNSVSLLSITRFIAFFLPGIDSVPAEIVR